MTIFDGFVVALDLDSSTNIKKKQELKKLITDNNGQFSFVLNKQCNLLVTNANENAENSYKCRLAVKNNIPVVSTDFLYDCVSKGKTLAVKHYRIVEDASTQQFNKGIISSQSNEESEHKISNVIKVWKDDDKTMPQFEEENYEVVEHECFLSTGEKHGKTLFSVIELHASKLNSDNKMNILHDQSNNRFSFRISLQTGSIKQEKNEEKKVKREFRFTENPDLAMKAFLKLCQQQGLVGMIKVDDLPHRDAGSKKLQMKLDLKRLLDQPEDAEVEDLVEEIWRESIGCMEKMIHPSSLSMKLDQIEKAESILIQLKMMLNNNKGEMEDLEKEFYAIIPHINQAREGLKSKKSITRKLELCQLLKDFVSVSESTGSSATSTTSKKYKALRCVIKSLGREEFDAMRNTITDSILPSAQRQMKIERIFKIVRPFESFNFTSQVNNIKLMFHATKPENVLGILSRGLLLPRVVVDEFGGSLTDVGRLGGGIYFADSVSTSVKYSEPSKSSGNRFMFASSVALGACKDFLVEETTLSQAPSGFNSCHAVGKFRNNMSTFEDDEYVIYSTNQQRLEYLVEFKLDGDPVIPRSSDFTSGVTPDQTLSEMDEVMEKLGEVSVNDILKLKDPLSACKAGLLLKDTNISIPLKAVHVFIKMIDLVAEVTVLQQYLNSGGAGDTEVKYVFPLDEDATVYGFEAFINGKHIIGEVKEKVQARAEYKEAVSKGHGAYLMDQDEQVQNLFVISVGNLPSAAEAVIKINYVTQLTVEDGDVCFNLPGCVAPWKEEDTLGVQTQDLTKTLKVKPSSLLKTEVQVSIEMPFEIKRISSPTHNIRIKKTDTKAVVEVAQNQALASGFKLLVQLTNVHVPRMWVEQHQQLDSRACMLTFYPEFDSTTLRNSEVVFLVDQSNSMYQYEAIVTARQILLLFLKELPNDVLFNIILFGSDFSKLFTWCKPKSEEAIEDAHNFLKTNSKSMGRSSIGDLLRIFHLLTSSTITRNIIVITDGYLDDEFDVFRNVKDFLPKTRLFGIGVGPAANNHFLQNLARVGRGSHEYFDENIKSKWAGKVKNLVSKTSQPCVSEVSVEWQNFGKEEGIVQAPSHISSVFSGSRQVVFGFVPNCTMATLKANVGGQEIRTVVSTPELNITTGMMIHKLTAKAVVQDWMFGMIARDKLEDEAIKRLKKNDIINLSIQHSIVTKYTSFVAVEERTKDEIQGELNINDLLAKHSVDFLPYLGWDPSHCKVKLVCGDGSVVTVECPATSTTDDLLTLLSVNVSAGTNFVLKDPFSKSNVDLKKSTQTVWDCLVRFPEGFLCLSVEEDKDLVVKSSQRYDSISPTTEPQDSQKVSTGKELSGLIYSSNDDDDEYDLVSNSLCFERDGRREVAKGSFHKDIPIMEFPKGVDTQKKVHTYGKISDHALHEKSRSLRVSKWIEESKLESPKHEVQKCGISTDDICSIVSGTDDLLRSSARKDLVADSDYHDKQKTVKTGALHGPKLLYKILPPAAADRKHKMKRPACLSAFGAQRVSSSGVHVLSNSLMMQDFKDEGVRTIPNPPPPKQPLKAKDDLKETVLSFGCSPEMLKSVDLTPVSTTPIPTTPKVLARNARAKRGLLPSDLCFADEIPFADSTPDGFYLASSLYASATDADYLELEPHEEESHQQSFQQPLHLPCEKERQSICDLTDALRETPEIQDKLMTLLQKDDDSGYMFWELDEDLGALLGINSLLIKQLIVNQFSHIYVESSGTMRDLARFFATLTTFAALLISHMNHEKLDFQQLMRKTPLKQVQDMVAVYYFCIEITSKYPDFLKDFKHPLLENLLEFTNEMRFMKF